MKSMFFFFAFVLVFMILIGVYIYFRIRPLLAESGTSKGVLSFVCFVLVFFSFIIGFLLERGGFYALSSPFTYIGSWVLAAIMYFMIVFVLIDFFRIINAFTFKADILSFKYVFGDEKAKMYSLVSCIIVAVVLICGYFNAKFPVLKTIEYKTEKAITQNFRFVLISDVHLGMINCESFMSRLRDRINAENPDFVVIAGDFFDGDPYPVINSKVGEILQEIKTGCGIYAVNGNHEWLGNANLADEFLQKHGVIVLRDSVAKLPFNCYVVGREDISQKLHSKMKRKPLEELMQAVDTNAFSIVLDHQPPKHYEEEEKAAPDLELSGHTHAGAQLWPLFLITKRIYENDYGFIRKGKSDFYTTSGYGTWGPPIRTSARPEMVVFEVSKK